MFTAESMLAQFEQNNLVTWKLYSGNANRPSLIATSKNDANSGQDLSDVVRKLAPGRYKLLAAAGAGKEPFEWYFTVSESDHIGSTRGARDEESSATAELYRQMMALQEENRRLQDKIREDDISRRIGALKQELDESRDYTRQIIQVATRLAPAVIGMLAPQLNVKPLVAAIGAMENEDNQTKEEETSNTEEENAMETAMQESVQTLIDKIGPAKTTEALMTLASLEPEKLQKLISMIPAISML